MKHTNFVRAAALAVCAASVTYAYAASVSGAGATFPYPIYAKWADMYNKETGFQLNYQSIGSGGGIKQIKSKTVTFGASDMPLEPKDLTASGLVQFPTVVGGDVPVVNLDGIGAGDLTLDGPTLADIFLGKITKWDDPAIKKLNPNAKLPGHSPKTLSPRPSVSNLYGHAYLAAYQQLMSYAGLSRRSRNLSN